MKPFSRRMNGSRTRGAVAVMTPLLMILMLSFAGLAIDVARLLIVRNELQNAADAAALAGAGGLFNPASATPDWGNGVTQARGTLTQNGTEGVRLADAEALQAGYWDLSRAKGLQSQGITPGANDAAAVLVTISRSAGNNNGPVGMMLAQLFGVLSEPARATAVAVIAPPGGVLPGAIALPFALSSCLYSQFFDPKTGQPYSTSFFIGSSYHYGPCESGQWTSFLASSNSDSDTKNLIDGTTPSPALNIGDQIWIQNGTKTNLFNEVNSKLANTTVLIPVVSDPSNNGFAQNGGVQMPIVAFAAFYIESASGGSTKGIKGHFVANYKVTGSSGGVGPYYGAYVPPRLAY